ncbi:hypothetical protein, partial [Paenibacillus sp. NPDC057934]|uniref:hypothetical protein n=1 Tax=Paenibacillus sp. NPDC057934 TaxID=3346282 RepID=UPI0036DCC885
AASVRPEPGSNSPNWYLERAIAHFETSDENLHSHFEFTFVNSILTRCSVFKDQAVLVVRLMSQQQLL